MASSNDPQESKQHFFDELQTDYANNVAFESTVWDLKLIFGEYSDRDKNIEWHTSMTIPWAQAKLMCYYLQVNVNAFEAEHGRIRVPPSMSPPAPPPPISNATPLQKSIYEIVKRIHAEFMERLK